MKKTSNESGFSIIELLVVIGLAGIMALIVTQGFADSLFVYNRQRFEARLNQLARQAMGRMHEEIREGNTLYSVSTTGKVLGNNTLIVLVPSVDCSGKILKSSDTTLYTPATTFNHDQFIYFIDDVNDLLDPNDTDDPTNNKLKLQIVPATAIPVIFPSCRSASTSILAHHVQNKLDAPAVPLFQTLDILTGAEQTPNVSDRTVVVRLILQDTYRNKALRSDSKSNISTRN